MNIVSLGKLKRRGWRAPGLPLTPAPAANARQALTRSDGAKPVVCALGFISPSLHVIKMFGEESTG